MLSHETAFQLWSSGESPRQASSTIHITIPQGRCIQEPDGIRIHYCSHLDKKRHPVARPPRTRVEETVVDLIQSAKSIDDAMAWTARACSGRLRLTTEERVAQVIRHRRGVPWKRELLDALGQVKSGAHSIFELHFLNGVVHPHGLPKPVLQRRRDEPSGREYDDAVFPGCGRTTIVHLDGRLGHIFEDAMRDMDRGNAAVARGEDPLDYRWGDVAERPCRTAAQLAMILIRNGWNGSPRPCGRTGCTVAFERAA